MPIRYSKEAVKKVSKLMGRKPINRPGSCFDSSAKGFIGGFDLPRSAVLVHGIGVANMPGEEGNIVGHAWIEFTLDGRRLALDTTWGIATTVENYRGQLNVSHAVEYTREEFEHLWRRYGFPGPFDLKIAEVMPDKEVALKRLRL